MSKVVGTHLRRKRPDEFVDEFEQGVDRAGGAFAQRGFQPGEGLLDWIEVGRSASRRSSISQFRFKEVLRALVTPTSASPSEAP